MHLRLPVGQLLCLFVTACTLQPGPRYPRPALALAAPTVADAELIEIEYAHDDGLATGRLAGGGEEVAFELRRGPRAADETAPRDLVLLVPILAGGRELMSVIAERLVGEGFDVAFCQRVGSALTPPQRTADLDGLFRRTVLHQRLLLGWLRRSPEPPPAIFVLGLSMGGMVTTVLAAQEPDLTGIAICLSGGDLADLVLVSSERRVRRWLAWRRATDGIGDDGLRWELQQFLTQEPLRFAPAVPTEKVLFVSAALDTVVPRRNQSLLWEALGRPTRLDLPLAHYSAALALDRVIQAAAEHFRSCGR